MRAKFLTIGLLLFLVTCFWSGQAQRRKGNPPTKSTVPLEPKDWLVKTLNVDTVFTKKTKNGMMTHVSSGRLSEAKVDGCSLSFRETTSELMNGSVIVSTDLRVSFNLGDIDPAEITISPYDDRFAVTLPARAGKKITVAGKVRGPLSNSEATNAADQEVIFLNQEATAKEVVQVFTKLSDSCK